MNAAELLDNPAERRKEVRLRVRPDLHISEQRYEGKAFHVVKDPVCLRYYRFNKQEYFVFSLFDGGHSMEDVRKRFEDEFKPHRLEFQDLESFARQLVTAGLVQHETGGAGKHLFARRAKQRRMKRIAAVSNIMYWKIPVFDPDRILAWMYGYLWWIFTWPFFAASVGLMLAAVFQVLVHFDTFYAKMPEYQEFFAFRTAFYMWLSLGVVKIIHEFGHGLSCKAYKGECHEMGVLAHVSIACALLQRDRRLDGRRQVEADRHQLRRHLRRAGDRGPGHLRVVVHPEYAGGELHGHVRHGAV